MTPEPLSRPKGRLARVRGGVSFGAYQVWDQSEAQFDFQQRTGRADVSAWDIGGKPLFFNLRFRSRQDIRARGLASRTPTDKRDDRLYELALRYQPPEENFAFEVGRIGASNFVGIGYLDGALAQVRVRSSPLQVGGVHRPAGRARQPRPRRARPQVRRASCAWPPAAGTRARTTRRWWRWCARTRKPR